MRRSPFPLAFVALVAFASSALAQPACFEPATAPVEAGACATVPVIGTAEQRAPHGCGDARMYFIDFPVWGDAPPADFGEYLKADLTDWALEKGTDLCRNPACDPDCHNASGSFEMKVSALLDERPSSPSLLRREGHFRHWRIALTDGQGQPQVVDPAMHCAVVAAIRDAAVEAGLYSDVPQATLDGLKIGREACAVTPMGQPGGCVPVEPYGFDGGDGQPGASVAIIDTGIEVTQRETLRVRDETEVLWSPSLASAPGLYHPHGATVAEMVRGVVGGKGADVYSYQAMTSDGFGVVSDLARAMDMALHELEGPTVLNLSLGWMPELGRPRTLAGDSCETTEDDIGEAVRYLLAVARELDGPGRPVAVVAAAGNRPLSGELPWAYEVRQHLPVDPMTRGWWTDADAHQPMLMPAEYAAVDNRLIVPVGAVDDADHRGALSTMPTGTEPHLVAPGQSMALASLDAMTGGAMTTLSGSSLAAGRVSGLIARAMDGLADRRAIEPTLPALDGVQTAALVYLTGAPVGRDARDGLPIHRADASRLDAALDCPNLEPVTKCIADHSDRADWLTYCLTILIEECAPPAAPPCGMSGTPGGKICVEAVDLDVRPALPGDTGWTDGSTGLPVTFGQPANMPVDRIDRALSGAVGPSPYIGPCTDCWAYVGASVLGLYLDMPTLYPAGTTFADPYVLAYDTSGGKHVIEVDFGGAALGPGTEILVTGTYPTPFTAPVATALLVTTIEQTGKAPVLGYTAIDVYQ